MCRAGWRAGELEQLLAATTSHLTDLRTATQQSDLGQARRAGLGAAAGLQQLRSLLLSLPGQRQVHSIEAGPGLDPSIRQQQYSHKV